MSSAETISTLAAHMKQSKSSQASANKPVFWLGAGCSVYDGAPLMDTLLQTLLARRGAAWGSPQFQFDQFFDVMGQEMRAQILGEHFNTPIKPDSPYHGLVHLLREGYADLVFTFNIDRLLEQAAEQAGLREGTDYLVIAVPELLARASVTRVDSPNGPRIRIVKLHGDFMWGLNYMTSREIVQYNDDILELTRRYSQRTAVVCGYSFFHLNVLNAFSRTGESFYYVNRSFPEAPMVLSLMTIRSQHRPLFVDQPLGLFNNFIPALSREIGI